MTEVEQLIFLELGVTDWSCPVGPGSHEFADSIVGSDAFCHDFIDIEQDVLRVCRNTWFVGSRILRHGNAFSYVSENLNEGYFPHSCCALAFLLLSG